MKTINNKLIRSFDPCYDPSTKGIPENETLTVLKWVEKYKSVVPANDILWLLLRNEFLSDKELRLFAAWCAREALKFIENPDQRSIDACDVAERLANGKANKEDLKAAGEAAEAARKAAGAVRAAAWIAAWEVAGAAAEATAGAAQLQKLMENFK